DPHIAANIPAQFLQALVERCKSILTLRVIRSPVHEDANPPQTFRLLRARRERPRGRRAAQQRDELASSHIGHGGVLPPALCQRSAPRLSRSGRQVLWQHLKCSEWGSRRVVKGCVNRAGANPWRLPGSGRLNDLTQEWGWRGMLSDRQILAWGDQHGSF